MSRTDGLRTFLVTIVLTEEQYETYKQVPLPRSRRSSVGGVPKPGCSCAACKEARLERRVGGSPQTLTRARALIALGQVRMAKELPSPHSLRVKAR